MSAVAALIPAYQAAARLGEILLGLERLDPAPEVLVVDDGSRDGTAQVARTFGARVLSFAGNRGKGHALLAGFRELRAHEAIVTLDADGQHPPECFPSFVAAWRAGADLVLGRRARTVAMPWTRRFANGFSSAWTSRLAGTRISDSQCGYRLYTRGVIERARAQPGRYELETAIVVRAARLGFRLAEVEIPTVYGEGASHIHPLRDVPRIVGALARLTLERPSRGAANAPEVAGDR